MHLKQEKQSSFLALVSLTVRKLKIKNAQYSTYYSSTLTSWLVFITFDNSRITFIQGKSVTYSGFCSLILTLV